MKHADCTSNEPVKNAFPSSSIFSSLEILFPNDEWEIGTSVASLFSPPNKRSVCFLNLHLNSNVSKVLLLFFKNCHENKVKYKWTFYFYMTKEYFSLETEAYVSDVGPRRKFIRNYSKVWQNKLYFLLFYSNFIDWNFVYSVWSLINFSCVCIYEAVSKMKIKNISITLQKVLWHPLQYSSSFSPIIQQKGI